MTKIKFCPLTQKECIGADCIGFRWAKVYNTAGVVFHVEGVCDLWRFGTPTGYYIDG